MATKPNVLVQLAASISDVLSTRENGGLCDAVCKAIKAQFKSAPISKDDGDFICNEVARARAWTPKAVEVRKSELRAIMSVYQTLPDAMEKLRASRSNAKAITFEAGVKLARSLKAGRTPTQAVAAFVTKTPKVDPADRTLEQSIESASTHVKRILEHKKLPAAFRSALAALCVTHDITV